MLNYINFIATETLTNHWVVSIYSCETFQMYFIVIDFNLKKKDFWRIIKFHEIFEK